MVSGACPALLPTETFEYIPQVATLEWYQSQPNANGFCNCPDEYSLEPHGSGYAIYIGRCPHRHGFNLANLKASEIDMRRLEEMIAFANKGLSSTK